MFVLSVQYPTGEQRRESFDKSEINVGRMVGNDVLLAMENVSKHHARILHRDGRFIVTDLKSTSGTFVNGRKIVQATIVRVGDTIAIGEFLLRCGSTLEDLDVPASPLAAPAATPPPLPGGPIERRKAPDVFRDRAVVEAPSRITRVVVHARGALVTREVDLPADLRSGTVDIMIGQITPLAHGGSVRAALTGTSREVTQIETALHHSAGPPESGPTRSRVRELEERVARLKDEGGRLTRRREMVANVQLAPPIRTIDRRHVQRDGLDTRLGDAARVAELISKTTAQIDEELSVVRRDLAKTERELAAARLEDSQASSVERMGDNHPTRAVIVRLRGEGPPGKLAITYAVPAARFWPTYTLRLADGGKRATWSFEAIVAQRSGEDWTGVPLSLSTGDLVFDARLPELTSLRIGRAMPRKRAAYRAPPEGVETMFSFYLEFAVSTRPVVRPPSPRAMPAPARAMAQSFSQGGEDDDEGDRQTPPYAAMAAAMPRGGAMDLAAHMPPPPPAMRRRMSAPSSGMAMAREEGTVLPSLGYGGAPMDMLESQAAYEAPAEPEIVPSEAWDDYDNLALAGAEDTTARGRLVAVADPQTQRSSEAASYAIERTTVPGHVDPLESRGVFDHRYDADGACDVPSDGRVHIVPVRIAECPSHIQYTTVPSEAADVYREAVLVNPFAGPLLAGPVDVYFDGALVTTAPMNHIDRGGHLRVGMGVDDRFKVARNVRTSEESVGLIGGSRAVTHSVSIELTASVRDPVSVTVLERVPVSDEKAVKIEIASERPASTVYDQSDRGVAIRGARRFEMALEPGKKALIEIVYRVILSNKLDIVGGSRRG